MADRLRRWLADYRFWHGPRTSDGRLDEVQARREKVSHPRETMSA